MGSWRAELITSSGIDTPFTVSKTLDDSVDIDGADIVKWAVRSESAITGAGLELRLFDSVGNKALIDTAQVLTGTDSFELVTFDLNNPTPLTPGLLDITDVKGFEFRLFIGTAVSGTLFHFDNMVAESL